MKKAIIVFSIGLFTLMACSEPDCVSTAGELVKMGFYSYPKDSAVVFRINSLQLKGSNTLLVSESVDAKAVSLPLNPTDSTITAYFDTEFGEDTVQIGYDIVSRIITENCGVEILYTNIRTLKNTFDSIRVVNSNVLINFQEPGVINENIRIYN